MDTMIVAETLSERLIRSYMEGAESGMVEVRGYGLTASERADAEREAISLYGTPKIAEASALAPATPTPILPDDSSV